MASPFLHYHEYVGRLRELAQPREWPVRSLWVAACEKALNGEAGRELERLVPIASRRRAGTFFTGTRLADQLAARVQIDKRTAITDPTVGAGDLILAIARRGPLGRTVDATLERWTEMFSGLDRVQAFTDATRLRLWLLAHFRHDVKLDSQPPKHCLTGFQNGNLLERPESLASATDVLLNPPFSRIAAPHWFEHADGKVNAAAVITEFTMKHVQAGTRVFAILPEVLRTGSRYEKWRQAMTRMGDVRDVKSCGLFDSADVDVFLVTLEKRSQSIIARPDAWSPSATPAQTTIGREFKVSVGAVVDYRDPHEGGWHAYIHPRNVKVWAEVKRISECRRFEGTVVKPPFVVLRRTSRPGDRWRASASIVTGKRSVAVENHLIVCEPTDKALESCRALVRQLKTAKVNDFLDRRIRCRHLTVGAVKEIPFERQ